MTGPVLIYQRREDRRGDLARRLWMLRKRLLRALGLARKAEPVALSLVRDAQVKPISRLPRRKKAPAKQALILRFPERPPERPTPPSGRRAK